MLVLGCGNDDRGDDAAGLLVVRRLGQLGVEAREHTGDMLGLIEAWAGADEVILIDAVKSRTAPGTVLTWDSRSRQVPACEFRCSTHDLGVAETVELARALGRVPPKLTIYGIEGVHFERGGRPSREVQIAARGLAWQLSRSLEGRSNSRLAADLTRDARRSRR